VLSALTIVGRMSDPAQHKWLALDIVVGIVACGLLLGLRPPPDTDSDRTGSTGRCLPRSDAGIDSRHADRRPAIPLAYGGPVALFQATAHLVQGLLWPIGNLPFLWFAVLDFAVHAALLGWGQWVQARQQLLSSLRERAQRAEAEQGRRVAEARPSNGPRWPARCTTYSRIACPCWRRTPVPSSTAGFVAREARQGGRRDPHRGAPGARRVA
jgi:hypothetical protein